MWIHAEAIGAIDILQNQVYLNFFMTRGKRRRLRGKMGLIMRARAYLFSKCVQCYDMDQGNVVRFWVTVLSQ